MQSDGVVTMAAHWEAEQDAAAACHGKVDLAPGGAAREPSTGQVLETMNAVGEADFGRQVDQDAVRLFCLGVEEDELITAADQIGMGSKVGARSPFPIISTPVLHQNLAPL